MATLTCYSSFPSSPTPKSTSKYSLPLLLNIPNPQHITNFPSCITISSNQNWTHRPPIILRQCSNFNTSSSFTLSESETETEEDDDEGDDGVTSIVKPNVNRKRRRYRKQYPGEKKGITEEMRFVAMKLRNSKGKKISESDDEIKDSDGYELEEDDEDDIGEETWEPSMEGFIKYLVDSKLVFSTIERIVDESSDAFEKLLEEKELEFYKWEGDEEELLRGVRESFNMLAKHWSRDDKNKCLREVTKAFRFMGQIVRHIIIILVLGSILNLKERHTSIKSLYFPLEEVPIGAWWNEFYGMCIEKGVQNPAMEAFQCINKREPRVDICVARRWKSSSRT
ncbi:hypothetical protein RND71_027577 [Anisodus tanguticus]|uniref:Uncharacterized protein n=1 Tax=Anisodus tanguticus TaxID=243964 RepID=A0AAE1V886_9SOLA|nr:hypothetical protein RND71_027577 [Anisodus tanguticus]